MHPIEQTHAALAMADLALIKRAEESTDQYLGIAHQQYLPVNKRRQLSPDEEARVANNADRWLPKIFTSWQDTPDVKMFAPRSGAVLGGLTGAGMGGLAGAMLGGPIGGGLGLLAGAGIGAPIGYFSRRAANETLAEQMRRLPEGATLRDIMSDPVIQAEMNRAAMRAAATARAVNTFS